MTPMFSDQELNESIGDDAYQNLDKRGSQDPVPVNIEYYLTSLQLEALHNLEGFGWRLAFVRRPLFELPTAVLISPESKQYATLEDDGSLNTEPQLKLRGPLPVE